MQAICLAARHSFSYEGKDSRSSSKMARQFLFRSLAQMSNKALQQFAIAASKQKIDGVTVARMGLQGTCAVLESAAILWAGMFGSLKSKIGNGVKPLLFIRKARYDESPLKIRLVDGDVYSKDSETSTHAKVLQTESSFHLVFQDTSNQRVWSIQGFVPTHLKVLDATTAENLKAAVLQDVDCIPGWQELAHMFPWQLQRTTVDRYPANYKAEKAMLADNLENGQWSKYTKSCDVHVIAQVHTKTMSVLDDDISGLLHTALSQQGAGVLTTLHDILRAIFTEETNVIYHVAPAGMTQKHREEVYDLYLPLPTSGSSMGSFPVQSLIKRHLLNTLLNGDIQEYDITHYCGFGCRNDISETVEKLNRFAVFALMSCKQPRFARNRWNNHEDAVNWSGLF